MIPLRLGLCVEEWQRSSRILGILPSSKLCLNPTCLSKDQDFAENSYANINRRRLLGIQGDIAVSSLAWLGWLGGPLAR